MFSKTQDPQTPDLPALEQARTLGRRLVAETNRLRTATHNVQAQLDELTPRLAYAKRVGSRELAKLSGEAFDLQALQRTLDTQRRQLRDDVARELPKVKALAEAAVAWAAWAVDLKATVGKPANARISVDFPYIDLCGRDLQEICTDLSAWLAAGEAV